MKSKLVERLKLRMQPVGIRFTDIKPEGAFEFSADRRTCVISMILACEKGTVVAVSDETCSCAGGAVGLCFGDAFARRGHKILELLSTGTGENDETPGVPHFLKYGERFFASPEIVQRWKDAMPLIDVQRKYRVLTPLEKWEEDNPPELVYLFANPDQLSALVILCGYFRGTALNVVAPFAAACQSILLAYQEIGKKEPQAILGGFDLSQRHRISKELLTLTLPYDMFAELEQGVDTGCLTTDAWLQIADRFE